MPINYKNLIKHRAHHLSILSCCAFVCCGVLTNNITFSQGLKKIKPIYDDSQPSSGTTKLYGRIDEIVKDTSPKLPSKILNSYTDKSKPLVGHTSQNQNKPLTGSVQSFPDSFEGSWAGYLTVCQNVVSNEYYKIDRNEAANTASTLKFNMQGSTCFNFFTQNNKIFLKPARISFSIPFSESWQGKQLNQNLNEANPFFDAMKNAMNQAPVRLDVILGDAYSLTGVSGNTINSKVVSNTTKMLSNNTIEQDVITLDNSKNNTTNAVLNKYSETVLLFKKINSRQMYVETASVNFTTRGVFLNKLVFKGYVNKISNNPNTHYSNNQNTANPQFNTIQNMFAPLKQLQNLNNNSNNNSQYIQNFP